MRHAGQCSSCVVCGEAGPDKSFVMLVWKDAEGVIQHRRYCAEWVGPMCWAAYERDATVVGFA